jgi:hypothetical protein
MAEKAVNIVELKNTPGCDVLVHCALAPLPVISPEPSLVGWNRDDRTQLEDSVLTLDDLDLSPGLVKVVPPAKSWRQCNRPSALHTHEPAEVVHHPMVREYRNAVKPQYCHP